MKKIQSVIYWLFIVAFLVSCQRKPVKPVEVGDSFGAGVSKPGSTVAFADVLKQLETSDTVKAVMKAKVLEVCQEKGCWINLVDPASATDESLFVKFKGYSFFVPKDIAGREVLVEGMAFKQETSVKQLRHYAEDAGKSEEEIAKITEPKTEKKFMASGVVVLN